MLDARSLVTAAVDYVRKNPDEVVRAVVNAAGLRFGVPLAALRYLTAQAKLPRKAPKDIEIGSAPPALRIGLTVDAMGTALRANAVPSWQTPNERPSWLQVCVPQALQYPMKHTRELPGTQTPQRVGHAL
jgi:hypothetical protein